LLLSGILFDGGESKFSAGAADARRTLIDDYGWEIVDGGAAGLRTGGD